MGGGPPPLWTSFLCLPVDTWGMIWKVLPTQTDNKIMAGDEKEESG